MFNSDDVQSKIDTKYPMLSTVHVPQREKLDYWRSLVEKKIVPLEFKIDDGDIFEGSLYSGVLGPATLSVIKATPHVAQRKFLNHYSSGSEFLVFNLVLMGNLIACQDGKESVLSSGAGAVVNAERAYRLNITQNTELAVLQIPKKMLTRNIPGLDQVVAKNLAFNNPVYPLVVSYVKELAACMGELSPQTALKVTDNLVGLLVALVTESMQNSPGLISDHKLSNLLRVKAFVEENLQNSDLCPEVIASSLGVSTRYINQLMSVEDTSLSRYIWQQRLERVARSLQDPLLMCQNISTLAYGCGFNDMSHFSKVFRKYYNLSPSEFRRKYLSTD